MAFGAARRAFHSHGPRLADPGSGGGIPPSAPDTCRHSTRRRIQISAVDQRRSSLAEDNGRIIGSCPLPTTVQSPHGFSRLTVSDAWEQGRMDGRPYHVGEPCTDRLLNPNSCRSSSNQSCMPAAEIIASSVEMHTERTCTRTLA